jgi:hypothetical protein
MEPASTKSWIELIAAATIPITIIAVIWQRVKGDFGLSVRSIQFLGLPILLVVVLILSLEGILERSAVGALVGALVGYLFSSISETDRKPKQPKAPPADNLPPD